MKKMKILDWVLSSGVLALVLFFGYVLGFVGCVWSLSDPIYCGDKPCAFANAKQSVQESGDKK